METSTGQLRSRKIFTFTNNLLSCEHLGGAFSKFSKYLRMKLLFIFKDSRNLRSKSNKVVLHLFICSILCFAMLDFLRCNILNDMGNNLFINQHYLRWLSSISFSKLLIPFYFRSKKSLKINRLPGDLRRHLSGIQKMPPFMLGCAFFFSTLTLKYVIFWLRKLVSYPQNSFACYHFMNK